MGQLKYRHVIVLYLLPALALYCTFFIVPFLKTFYYSFFDWNGFGKITYVGIKNYVNLASDPTFIGGIGKVLIWALLAILLKVGSGLVLASMLRRPVRGSKFFSSAFFMPVVISTAAIALMFTLIYDLDAGLLNSVLRQIGLGQLARTWLGDKTTAFYAVIAAPIWHTIGYFFIILLAGMQNISEEIYESATIDGATAWVLFTRITVPLVWPILQICIILAITGAIKNFDYVFIMTKGGPGTSTQVPATYMYDTIFVSLKYGYGTAIAFAIFLFSFIVTVLFRKLTSVKE
ncbi:carbohydrate ABC transporter permease [Paenibacillus thalictri]|uniref:Sugar ABC transporter permease n=1 Tax=Paenibacillus thalictri TaxID=2527873 RepID=A0A4V2J3F2_9BACL|nr:sugar ABC transporter permease [Paenibacillus thalictri]TBL71592.1 sugar ABC transporter permease [Paenibacillus thalictri]